MNHTYYIARTKTPNKDGNFRYLKTTLNKYGTKTSMSPNLTSPLIDCDRYETVNEANFAVNMYIVKQKTLTVNDIEIINVVVNACEIGPTHLVTQIK